MKLISSIASTLKQKHFHRGHKKVKQINIPTKNIFLGMSLLYFNVQHPKKNRYIFKGITDDSRKGGGK